MTTDEFRYMTELKRELEFAWHDTRYNVTYDTDAAGKPVIVFGETYFGTPYPSFGALMNEARVGNSFLREVIKEIPRP